MNLIFAQTLLNAGGAVARGLSRFRVPSARPSSGGGHAVGEAGGHLVPHIPGPDGPSLVWPWVVAVLAVVAAVAVAVGVFHFVKMAAVYSAYFQKPEYAAARANRRAWAASALTLVVGSLLLWLGYPAWKGWLDRTHDERATAEVEHAARVKAVAKSVAEQDAVKAAAARAIAHNQSKDYDRCLAELAVVINHDMTGNGLKYRAELLSRLGRHGEAAADYARLYEIDPSLLPLCQWTESLRKAGQAEAADRAEAAGVVRLLDALPESGDPGGLTGLAIKWKHEERVAPRVEKWAAEVGADTTKEAYARASALDTRAEVRFARKDYAGAIADWGAVVAIQPKWTRSHQRAGAWVRLKDYRAAVAELDAAAGRGEFGWLARVELAWLQATCPDDTIRDAKAAREHAAAGLDGLRKHLAESAKRDKELRESVRNSRESRAEWNPLPGIPAPFQFPEVPVNPPDEPADTSKLAEWHSRLITAAIEAEAGNMPEARRLLAEMRKGPLDLELALLWWPERYKVLAKAIDAGRPVRDPAE